ncbi:MAG: RagB/SusD family nutrient uptake outer membrane protein [Chitinophagaceae bacterium]|nr:RagB/SusD family nutrient uptake outer membrane protein [Chitinophagaceae bacterium]
MKLSTYNKLIFFLAGILFTCSCSDKEFLHEDFRGKLDVEGGFLTKAQFDGLSAAMYRNVQVFYNSADGPKDAWILGMGTDVCLDASNQTGKYNNWALVNSVDNYSGAWYDWQYDIIKVANTIIKGAENPKATWASEEVKNGTIAEARFFRGFAYRNLANVFGGVPIVAEPLSEVKDDFVRNTREECWAFAKADLEFARTNLPITTNSPGRVVRAAADHFLAEVNISLKDFDGAIAAATRVIDQTDGSYSLVKQRFGKRASETNKDYYWDLFVMGNHNRQAGNEEGIWVAQFEIGDNGAAVIGGVPIFNRPLIERRMWCQFWNLAKAGYNSIAHDSTGRGVGHVRPTNYTNYTIWENAGNDIRNNEINIKRNYYFAADVPGHSKGDLIPRSFLTTKDDTMLYIFPNWQKFGTDKHINALPDNGFVPDFYIVRLPETYLLRAEAYLAKGRTDLAADDINVIRDRAQAPLITASDVTLDYILDERARELYGEEFRILTLGRLGLIYERTKKYGWEPAQASVQPHNNLMPIPLTAINRNVGVKLEQNPGYE